MIEKKRLDYFPLDIDFFDDEKIVAVGLEYGIKGEFTAIRLLCEIYRNGYYIQWSEPVRIMLCQKLKGVSSNLLEQIVGRLVHWGFFDKALFDSDKILTSRGIQKRYFTSYNNRTTKNLPYLLETEEGRNEERCGVQGERNSSCPSNGRSNAVRESRKAPQNNSNESSKIGNTARAEQPSAAEGLFDTRAFISFFNETVSGTRIPQIKNITEGRKVVLDEICRKHGKASLSLVIRKSAASDYLSGRKKSNFKATFKWMMNPENFENILDGNYDNESLSPTAKNNSYGDTATAYRTREDIDAGTLRSIARMSEKTGCDKNIVPVV